MDQFTRVFTHHHHLFIIRDIPHLWHHQLHHHPTLQLIPTQLELHHYQMELYHHHQQGLSPISPHHPQTTNRRLTIINIIAVIYFHLCLTAITSSCFVFCIIMQCSSSFLFMLITSVCYSMFFKKLAVNIFYTLFTTVIIEHINFK